MFVALGNSADADSQQEALERIADFADRMCAVIELKGEDNNINISGKLESEFSALVKRLADLGIEGAINKSASSYKGVPHIQLVEALSNSIDCKLLLWRDLKEKFLSEDPSANDHDDDKQYLQTYDSIQTFNQFCSSDHRSGGAELNCADNLCEIKFLAKGNKNHKEINFNIEYINATKGTHINLTNAHLDIDCKLGECIQVTTKNNKSYSLDEYDIYYSNTSCIDELLKILK